MNELVQLVVNGKEVLAALEQNAFDAILMDIQMPVMSGLEATSAIRRLEHNSGRHVPIIATTAHAMAADRDDALQSGMDAYLSKPIQAAELYATIERLTWSSGPATQLDEKTVIDGLGGDRKLLRDMIRIFLEDSPRTLRKIRTAIRLADNESLRSAAHSLKGAVANFGRNDAFEAARVLETIGRENRLDEAAPAFEKLKEQLSMFRRSLAALAR